MKRFLSHRSNRWGYDGWALQVKDAPEPLQWTTCTTRAEARELKHELQKNPDLFQKIEIVKVKINVEIAAGN